MNREQNFREHRRDTKKGNPEFEHPTHKYVPLVNRTVSSTSMSESLYDPYQKMKSKYVKELASIHRQKRTTDRDYQAERRSNEVRMAINTVEPVYYLPSPSSYAYPAAVNTNTQNEPSSYYRNEHRNIHQQNQPTAYQSHMSNYGKNTSTEVQQQQKSTSHPVYRHASSIHAHSQSLPRNNTTHSQSYSFSQSNYNHIQPVIGSTGSVGANYGSLVINNVSPVNFIYCMNPGYVTTTTTLAPPVTIAHAPPNVHSPPLTTKTTTDGGESAAEPMPVLAATAPSAPMISNTSPGSTLLSTNSTTTVTASNSPINASTQAIDTEIAESTNFTAITEKIHNHEFTANLRDCNDTDKFELMGSRKIMYANGRYYPSFCYPSFLHSTLHHILWALRECSIDYSENILYNPNTFHILLDDYAALKYFPQLLWDILYNEQVRVTNFYVPPGDNQIDLYITLREYEEAEIIKMLMLSSSAHYYITPLYQPTSINAMMVGFTPNEVDELTAYGMLGGKKKMKQEDEEEYDDSINLNRPKKAAQSLPADQGEKQMDSEATIPPKVNHENNNEDPEPALDSLLQKPSMKTMAPGNFHDAVSTILYSEKETKEGVNYPALIIPEPLEMTKICSNNFDDVKFAVLFPGKQKKIPLSSPNMKIKHSENLSDVFAGTTQSQTPVDTPETTDTLSDTFSTPVGSNVSSAKQSPTSYAQAVKSPARFKVPLQTNYKRQNQSTQRKPNEPVKPRQNTYKFSSFSSVESVEDYNYGYTTNATKPVAVAPTLDEPCGQSSMHPYNKFSNEVEENLNIARLNAEKITLEENTQPETSVSPHLIIEIEEDKSVDINIDVRNKQVPIYYCNISADELSESEDDEMLALWIDSSVNHSSAETTLENDHSNFNEDTHRPRIITSIIQENLTTEVNQLHLNPGTTSVNETISVNAEEATEEATVSTNGLMSQFGLEQFFNLGSIFGRRNSDSSQSK